MLSLRAARAHLKRFPGDAADVAEATESAEVLMTIFLAQEVPSRLNARRGRRSDVGPARSLPDSSTQRIVADLNFEALTKVSFF